MQKYSPAMSQIQLKPEEITTAKAEMTMLDRKIMFEEEVNM